MTGTRRITGAILLLAGALVFAARHVGAMVFVANKTGELSPQYEIGLGLGDPAMTTIAVAAFALGVVYLVWAEVRPEPRA